MRRKFDDKLKWPFWGDVHVQLLSWEEGEDLHTRVIPFDESAHECTAAGRDWVWFMQICLVPRCSSEVLEKRLPESACIFFTRDTAVILMSQTLYGQ